MIECDRVTQNGIASIHWCKASQLLYVHEVAPSVYPNHVFPGESKVTAYKISQNGLLLRVKGPVDLVPKENPNKAWQYGVREWRCVLGDVCIAPDASSLMLTAPNGTFHSVLKRELNSNNSTNAIKSGSVTAGIKYGQPRGAISPNGELAATVLARPSTDVILMSNSSEASIALWKLDAPSTSATLLTQKVYVTRSEAPHLAGAAITFLDNQMVCIVLSGKVYVYKYAGSTFERVHEIDTHATNVIDANRVDDRSIVVFHFDIDRTLSFTTVSIPDGL